VIADTGRKAAEWVDGRAEGPKHVVALTSRVIFALGEVR